MPFFRVPVFAALSLCAALLASTCWLTGMRQSTVFADGRQIGETDMTQREAQPVAVVELFTSEGCSSCPPADENLRRIATLAEKSTRKVFPLSFHVDYWNRLGWKDPFSQAAFSERQREYAEALDSDTYTPQMIVNGTIQFVGSDRRHTDRAIQKALETPVKHAVKISSSKNDDRIQRSFEYRVTGPEPAAKEHGRAGYVLNVAVATDSETVSVVKGENTGRKLTHNWVVKSFQVIPLSSLNGTFEIDNSVVKPRHSRVIVYIQSTSTHEISGASAIEL
jgi:hypothetical protein